MRADRETYRVLAEKTSCKPWSPPAGFSIQPDPRSRFCDPTPTDDPMLPIPAPKLYAYSLPELPPRDPARLRDSGRSTEQLAEHEEPGRSNGLEPSAQQRDQPQRLALEDIVDLSPERFNYDLKFVTGGIIAAGFAADIGSELLLENSQSVFQCDRILNEETACKPWSPPTGFSIQPDPRSRFCDPAPSDDPMLPIPASELYTYSLPELPPRDLARLRDSGRPVEPIAARRDSNTLVKQVAYLQDITPVAETGRPAPGEDAPGGGAERTDTSNEDELTIVLKVVPIPKDVWQSLPENCLRRMFEFNSIRGEYDRSYAREPLAQQRDQSQRLALEDIVDLSLINSREYQTQKEALYQVALRLSLERFNYDLKFATGGHRTAANYSHNRNGGITVDGLTIPTTVTGDKLLFTGADLLARFANDVVLTFNGADGFAADIGSELLLEISQSVFQRDVVFEGLTQAERDVVYAARDFARYRKLLFRDLASQYYSLLLTFRGIEIDAQDYFSNLRAFNQGEAEYRAGRLPRFQVDQFEQNVLASRSRLISSCNSLESSLDDLKLRIGLPPELPVNLNLAELEELTLRDEITVSGELVRRARRILLSERQQAAPDHGVLLNTSLNLSNRMLSLAELRRRQGQKTSNLESLQVLLARLSSAEARLLARSNRRVLEREQATRPAAPPMRTFQRTMDLVDSLLVVVTRELTLAEKTSADAVLVETRRRKLQELSNRAKQMSRSLEQAVADRQLDRIPGLIATAETLLEDTDILTLQTAVLTEPSQLEPEEELEETLRRVDQLLADSKRMLATETGGMVPVKIDMDDAMLTALVQRFDLMNDRGALADTWRQIKLAGDDLKSVLNLNAGQSIRTQRNRPFGFTFDESQTSLSLEFDTPLNRKAQRNAFRRSLINYQAGLRALMEQEDNIKASIRNDLRDLQLDREQYRIAVASAALAHERVVSTRMQLQLGVQDITARDFLESQQDYTASLSAVASEHIGYVRDRIQFFMDLELLEVDDNGFWPELYNEKYQPIPAGQFPAHAAPVYGELPCRAGYSCKVKRMLCVPPGNAEIHKQPADQSAAEVLPTPPPRLIPLETQDAPGE